MSNSSSTNPAPSDPTALVAEWTAAMEGVTPGEWYQTGAPWFRSGDGVLAGSPDGNIGYLIADLEDFAVPRDEYEGPFKLGDAEKDAAWIARCSPAGITPLLALIAQQAATIEANRAIYDEQVTRAETQWKAWEARATAAEAERDRLEAKLNISEAEAYDLKCAAAGGEDVPGSAHAVTAADVERWRKDASSSLAANEATLAKLRAALGDATKAECSNAQRLREAIVEARRRLAKGRSLWNGPCHECDGVLDQALRAENDAAAIRARAALSTAKERGE